MTHRYALFALGLALGLSTSVESPALAQKHGKKPNLPNRARQQAAPAPQAAPKKADKAAPKKADKAAPKAAAPPRAEAPAKPQQKHAEVAISIQRVKLDNGLRVVINVDRTSPTVAVSVVYDVGSRSEERGRSGFAHLFEHMMFQGSANVPKGDHFQLVTGHGGTLNGTTNADRTDYFEVLPANELALGLWLEADRMRSLDVSQDNFENQRKVVQEEYRMRVSNAAYQPSSLRLEELVYQGYWPYEHATIGSMADLDGAKLDWVRDFHARHYGPNSAVLTIAGDVDPNEALGLVHKYFDPIPRVAAQTFVDVPFPEQTSQRTAIVKDDHARAPGVLLGFAIPSALDPDRYALDLAAIILADGESSRLHQLLVRDKAIAQRVSAHAAARRGPGIFRVDAVLVGGADPAAAERLIEAEIKSLATRGPTDAEVVKARRQVEASVVLGLQSNVARARRLGQYELFWGDAGLVAGEMGRWFAAGKDDIKRAVGKHLGPTRRTIVETVPSAPPDIARDKEASGPAAAPPGAHSVPRPRGSGPGKAQPDARSGKPGKAKKKKP